jgi:N-acetylglutamate synthase-like GNAT family acetyltransferase
LTVRVRPARPDEAGAISALALRSKAHWGYDEAFLAACRRSLTFVPEEVVPRRMAVAERDGMLVGMVTLDGEPPEGEIGNVWVEPDAIGTGIGRILVDHAVERARALGFASLLIAADPNAEGFYRRMGAQPAGAVPSDLFPDRILPQFRLTVPAE